MAGALRPEVASYIRRKQLILTLDDDPRSDFRVDVNHEIHISLEKIERLWATLYAYTVIYDLQKTGRGEADLESTSDGHAARMFLDWAFGDPSVPWPAQLPRPADASGLTQNTNRLF